MQDDLVAMKFFFEDVCICFYLFLAKCLKKICTYHVVFHTPQFHTLLPSLRTYKKLKIYSDPYTLKSLKYNTKDVLEACERKRREPRRN